MGAFNVPDITKLNSEQPNYVANLDEGLIQIENSYKLLHQEASQFALGIGKNIVDLIKKEGISTKHEPAHKEEIASGITITIEEITSTVTGIEEKRRVEDLFRSYEKRCHTTIEEFEEKRIQLKRACEDYMGAIVQLTEIKPLIHNTDYQTAHFFVVREDGVYGTHVDFETGKVIPSYKLEGFKLNLSKESDCLGYIKDSLKGTKANVYLVKNPSNQIIVEELFNHAILTVGYQISNERQKKDEKKSPSEKLAEIIKEAINVFKV